jgi:DNA-binding response OmpR family regulator
MRVLIADDEPISRLMLEGLLKKWGYEVEVSTNGHQALAALRQENPPEMAILDWMMPEVDGVEVCRIVRQTPAAERVYILLLTARGGKQDIVEGLEAGADDYLSKPYDRAELRARLSVGARIVELQQKLSAQVNELEDALSQVKQLQGILPICSHCKKIRNDQDYWQQVDSYISAHTEVKFSHGVCPSCYEAIIQPELDRFAKLKGQ